MKIKIKRADGGVSISELAPEADPEAEVTKWAEQYGEQMPVAFELHDEKDTPTDRTFRAAWGHDLNVRMPEARSLWRDKLRAARGPKMAALDIEFSRAVGRKDQAAADAAEAKRQALRDAPADPRIEEAQTPDQLKAVTLP